MRNAVTELSILHKSGALSRMGGIRPRAKILAGLGAALILLISIGELAPRLFSSSTAQAAATPYVAVSMPLLRSIDQRLSFLGQFAALQQVDLRAQVGGTLKGVFFKDGDVVRQGQLLFQIDPKPYAIKLAHANAELESAIARLSLVTRELARAQTLKSSDAGSQENVDQKLADKASAQAAVDGARAMVRDARFDLDRTRVIAPFTGRIGTHLVSAGNLIAGSRAAATPTTLLTTLVSVDPIWLNFDMSEADYMTFLRQREKQTGPLADQVQISLSDEAIFKRQGKLDFVDNSLDRSSGTIHARATVPNSGFMLTPGGFARVRLAISAPTPVLLVPDAAVLPDQSDHTVLVLGKDDVVIKKKVETGDLRGGLRAIRAGLAPTDRVIIDGISSAAPGSKVSPHPGVISFGSDQNRSSVQP
jgi:RND family efflux transporter MFP subunit